ncbi:MAG: hypothetical protein Q4B70_03765 [Lachnospiraceae bacterium]|nr:hypothetical protein [Lachnospiraceae bacterium]
MKEEKFLLTMLIALTIILLFTAFFMFRNEKVLGGGILVREQGREAIVLEGAGHLSESRSECLL